MVSADLLAMIKGMSMWGADRMTVERLADLESERESINEELYACIASHVLETTINNHTREV